MPLRAFGSVSIGMIPVLTPNYIFCPCLRLLGTAGYSYSGNMQIVRIDAPAEGATFMLRNPSANVVGSRTLYLRLWLMDVGGGHQNLSIVYDSLDGTTGTVTLDFNVVGGAGVLNHFDVDIAADLLGYNFDSFSVWTIVYAAAGGGFNASNLDVVGLELIWL